jgi:glycosyltransferase involved in cell wall biosynthesis
MKNTSATHTFVICAYKESQYLEKCIQSLLSQTSVIDEKSCVVLYTSTPNQYIASLCERYRIPEFVGRSQGIGSDWNGALSCVKTQYATIAHQDDIYKPSYGDEILAAFTTNDYLNIVFSDYYEIDEVGVKRTRNLNLKIKTFGLKAMALSNNKTYQRRIYAFGNFICCPAVSYNLKRLANFRFDEKMKMALDWDAWERIMRLPGIIQYIPMQLMAHRIHEESETTANTLSADRRIEEAEMYERYWGRAISRLIMKAYIHNEKGNAHE